MTVLASVPAQRVEDAVVRLLEGKPDPVAIGDVFTKLSQEFPKYEVGPAIENLVFHGRIKADHLWKHLQIVARR